jgi:hypothetical protein
VDGADAECHSLIQLKPYMGPRIKASVWHFELVHNVSYLEYLITNPVMPSMVEVNIKILKNHV